MSLEAYDYPFERALIAQEPAEPRTGSRLLVLSPLDNSIEDKMFSDLSSYLRAGDLLVFNNSRVRSARIIGKKNGTGASIELLILEKENENKWIALAKPAKRLKDNTLIVITADISVRVISRKGDNFLITFLRSGNIISYNEVEDIIEDIGALPLPPYIKKSLKIPERYQTVYSKKVGSAATPTAGLHFTPDYIDDLRVKGIETVEIDLNVGLGTFLPVKSDNIINHKIHSERYIIDKDTATKLNNARAENRRIIAVGTTSMRALEANFRKKDIFYATDEKTDIFIYPGVAVQAVDALITNFHLPRSTLLMMVSAFAGYDNIMKVYAHAVKEKYRFYSLGDAMFLRRWEQPLL